MTPEQERDVDTALLAYWTSRDEAAAAQRARGVQDVGGRLGVTSGGHLDRIAQMLARVCVAAGAPPRLVAFSVPDDDRLWRGVPNLGVTLPGYYRPTKQWDLVVYDRRRQPILCIELKSQNGPSYGNNANNRVEESLGNAYDMRRAQEAGLIADRPPWLGYVYVIEDDDRSRLARGDRDRGVLDKDPIFNGWSYLDRVRVLSQRLVEDEHYDACWAVATSRPTCPATPSKPTTCPQIADRVPEHRHRHDFGWFELDSDVSGYADFVHSMTGVVHEHHGNGYAGPPTAQRVI